MTSHAAPEVTAAGGAATEFTPPGDSDQLAINTLRFLSADAVQAANSGHPGLPLGAAPFAWVLWSRYLRHDPAHPEWPDRDRFVLSAGHGSALLYSLLHVTGYDMPIEELRNFRQLGSRTAGHPEYGLAPGIETTTGPLGQGLANAVGMALAEAMLAARCNTGGEKIVDHRTWTIVGDGCLMEGISHEAASFAGKVGLHKLTVIWDDNDVTIDGPAGRSCADDAEARFRSYGFQTLRVDDGNDLEAIDRAYAEAIADDLRPTFIAIRTTIGYGSGVAGTSKAHGSPLGEAGLAAMRERFGWPETRFFVPPEVRESLVEHQNKWDAEHAEWVRAYAVWSAANPEIAAAFPLDRVPAPSDIAVLAPLADLLAAGGASATRKASGAALTTLAKDYPALVGGSADLASSTNTAIPGGDVGPGQFGGRTIHFGIREHAMGAIENGMVLHRGLRPFGSTFLVFSDYMRPAVRLSALMKLPVIYIFTHDSVWVGEDGPTHQPIEHVESLRLIPGLRVLRPADTAETALAWEIAAVDLESPTALILTRQDLPVLGGAGLDDVRASGARTVAGPGSADGTGTADVLLGASGSEVGLALAAAELLAADGITAQVLSVPWREKLEQALADGTAQLPAIPAVWIEAGVTTGWRALARPGDAVIGINRFGESGPGAKVAAHLGLTPEAVAAKARQSLETGSGK